MPEPDSWRARRALRAVSDLLLPVDDPKLDLHLVDREGFACLLQIIADELDHCAEA